jgi:hypothetical protein
MDNIIEEIWCLDRENIDGNTFEEKEDTEW